MYSVADGRIINESGYDVTNAVPTGQKAACSVCETVGINPFVDTDNGCAPVCRDCYDRSRESHCPTCGRSCSCG